jgi:cephalosporin hydroxylase
MSYEYPSHFKYPEDKRVFFTDHIPVWENVLKPFKDRPNITLEIGALYGGSSVYIIENFCKEEGSHHYIMDINNNEYLKNNLEPYPNVSVMYGESCNSFRMFRHDGQINNFLDIVYVDGNHMSKYVLEDAINSFYCLKDYGIMVFDDFGGGLEQPKHLQVKTAVESFTHSYEKHLNVIHVGYQFIVQKIPYINEEYFKENYYK